MRNNRIKNKADLAKEIQRVRLDKEIAKQKLFTDLSVLKNDISSIEAGIKAAKSVIHVFQSARDNQISPGTKLRNMAINFGIDLVNDLISQDKESHDREEPV